MVFREALADDLAAHPRLIGDGGYRGLPEVISPVRGPDGRIIRDETWRRLRRRRAVAEQVIAQLKVWQTLRDCRRRGPGIDQVTRAVAYLHNLRIDNPH